MRKKITVLKKFVKIGFGQAYMFFVIINVAWHEQCFT